MTVGTILNDLLKSTSVHGLRNLSSSKGFFHRLLWLIILTFAFSICGYMIWDTMEENAAHPITTTINSQLMSDLAFPAVTVATHEQKTSVFGYTFILHEQVFNYFKMDCSTYEGVEAEDCVRTLERALPHFHKLIERAIFGYLYRITSFDDRTKAFPELLCSNVIPMTNLQQAMFQLASFNGSLHSLILSFSDILAPLIFRPRNDYFMAEIEKGLYSLNQTEVNGLKDHGSKSFSEQCFENLENVDEGVIKILGAFLFLAQKPDVPIPFGSFVRYSIVALYEPQMRHIEDQLIKILQSEFGPAYVSDVMPLTSSFSYSESGGGSSARNFSIDSLPLVLINVDSLVQLKEAKVLYRKFAEKLATFLDLTTDSFITEINPIPEFLWRCELQSEPVDECFDFRPHYHTRGMASTMNFDFDEIKLPPLTKLPSSESREDFALRNDAEITLFIYHSLYQDG